MRCLFIVAQMKGEAEAFAVEAKAKAEAEQMARKADAWKQYEDAAVVDMVLEMLPKVTAHVMSSGLKTEFHLDHEMVRAKNICGSDPYES